MKSPNRIPFGGGRYDWLPQWFDQSETRDGARVITIASEGEVVPVPLVLRLGGRISGTITDARFQGATHLVYFTSADDPRALGFTFDRPGAGAGDPDTFTVRGLFDGDYKVGVWRRTTSEFPDQPRPGAVWYSGTEAWDDAQVISIRDLEVASGIDFVLP